MSTTSGQEAKFDKGVWIVPKPMLLDRLDFVLRMKKLRIAPGPLMVALIRELTVLEREVRDSGPVTFSTPSRKVHDDLVMAVWQVWEVHSKNLEMEGPVPLVSAGCGGEAGLGAAF